MMRPLIAVTCATAGIGQAVSEQLVSSGHDLILFGRDAGKLSNLKGHLAVHHARRIETKIVDFDADNDLQRLAAEENVIPALDGLVVIYPRIPKGPVAIMEAAENRVIWQRCFLRPLELVRILLNHVESDGRVVIVSGISNSQVFPSLGVSNVLRAAWLAQAKLLAFMLGERRIRVNTVSLGGTLTERFVQNRAQSPQVGPLEDHPGVIPLGEYGMPRNVAHVVEIMLGEFTAHITGANIVCDGGLSRHYC